MADGGKRATDQFRGGQMQKLSRVKNKSASEQQITAEQILREAHDRQIDDDFKKPKQKITDPEEMRQYRMTKRKQYEDAIRANRTLIGVWVKYAAWEESQREFDRARSVYERAIDIDYRNVTLWLKYAEMEMKHKFVNHARNIWDRAVTLLPRVAQLWFKYTYMEEMLQNIPGCRAVFERWMSWEPDESAWNAYVRFELRYGEVERARQIYSRYVACHKEVEAWLKWAKFEEKQREAAKCREVFETAVEALGEWGNDERLFIAFAKFEERAKEPERARAIYKYALDHIPKSKAEDLYKTFVNFEKQQGSRDGIEDVLVNKRRFQYEEMTQADPYNYDTWFDYVRLEEGIPENHDRVRTVYDKAVSNLPPAPEKRLWRRYIYLWINYAIYEELEAEDIERARAVYKECINQIPHKYFSFSKVWVMFANFEIRQRNLAGARKVYGHAIGMAPKDKIFNSYIQLEFELTNIDSCRMLYQKYLEWAPSNVEAWSKFAEMEQTLGEDERVRAIYELGVEQPVLDMPELMWKNYIDFETQNGEHENARNLYERLLEKTKHVKVWISYAMFEAGSAGDISRARSVFERGYKHIKMYPDQKEERVMMLESWLDFEQDKGDKASCKVVQDKMPRRIKKKRQLTHEDGSEAGWEEYYDYIFPEEQGASGGLKILEMAQKWKKQKVADA